MSTNLIINEQTKSMYQNNYNNNIDKNNEKMFNYSFLPSIQNNNNGRDSYIDSTKTIGIMQNDNRDLNGESIDYSTTLRNGSLRTIQSNKELDTRLFPGAPYMSSGQSVLKNTDLSSKLLFGEDTRTTKSANALSSYSADNFIPLVPSIEENIQNIEHIIPTYWVRGGMSTRTVVRNIDYLKSCGLKK